MLLLLVLSFTGHLLFLQGPAQKAHVHGLAEVSIAMDGLKGAVEFEAPAYGVLGFEMRRRRLKSGLLRRLSAHYASAAQSL